MIRERTRERSYERREPASSAGRPDARHDPVPTTPGAPLGATLPSPARDLLAPAFGHVIDQVSLHHDAESDRYLRDAHARAVTTGNEIHVRDDLWSPGSMEGVHLLAHELTHVVQQSEVDADSQVGERPERGDRGDEFEENARDTADAVSLGRAAPPAAASTDSVPVAQFEDDDPNWFGMVTELMGGDRDSTIGSVGESVWDFATNDVLGGALDFADAAKTASGLSQTASGALGALGTAGQYLSPLSIIQGGADLTTSLMSDESNFENTEQGVLGALNIFSGGTSLAGLMGALPSVAGSATLGSIGAAGGASMLAAGGQVTAAGLAGYGAGRLLDEGTGMAMRESGAGGLMDRGIDAALDFTGLGGIMDSVGGGDAAAGNRGDYTISDIGARAMTGVDQLFTAGMRGVGAYDEDAPAYTQTLGWQLAEILPSWMQ